MEYCPHCRAIRRTRKTTRTREETRDGQTVTVRAHTYHCAQCSRFLYTNEQVADAAPAAPASPPAPSGEDAEAGSAPEAAPREETSP